MKRLALLAVPVAAGGLALATQSAGGAAPPTVVPRVVHLVATSAQGGFGFRGHARAGDRFGFKDTIRGDDSGFDLGSCTLVTRRQAVCQVQFVLRGGQVSSQAVLDLRRHSFNLPLAGGTGIYEGALGLARVRDVTRRRTDIRMEIVN